MYVDTHCHLDDGKFTDLDNTVKEFRENGVGVAINMGCDIPSSKRAKDIADTFKEVYYAVGFHPEFCEKFSVDDLDSLRRLADDKKCVGVGEIGLDYHYTTENKDKQKECFIEQIKLANELKLPVSIHSRDATGDTISLLKQNKSLLTYGGVLHCFSGSTESAFEYINLGLAIGFGGTVTFKNAKNIVEVANKIPLDFILTETDSPYLAPEPFRGSMNTPKNIPQVVAKLSQIKNISPSKMEEIIENNAKRIFYKLK